MDLADASLLIDRTRLKKWRRHYEGLLAFSLKMSCARGTGTAIQKAEEHIALCDLAEQALAMQGRP